MKYGIPVTNGMLDPHFGHCEAFALIDVDPEQKTIISKQIITSPGHQKAGIVALARTTPDGRALQEY